MVPVTDDRRVRIKDNFTFFTIFLAAFFLFSHNAFIREIQRNGFMAPPGSESVYVSSRIRRGHFEVCSCRNDFKCSDQKPFLAFPPAISKAQPESKSSIFEVFF